MNIPFNTLYLVTNTTNLWHTLEILMKQKFSSVVTELSMKHNESLMNYILHAMKMHFIGFLWGFKPDVHQLQGHLYVCVSPQGY